MSAKFEYAPDANGSFRFRLKAGNGEIIMTSEPYSSGKDGCLNGIASCKENAQDESKFEVYSTDGGFFRFKLKAGNGQTIGQSQNYKTESGRDNGVQSVMKNAPEAEVVELESL